MKNQIKPSLLPIWWVYIAITGTIAFALGLSGIAASLYVGGWLMFIGGIADAITLFKGLAPVTPTDVAIAVGKIVFAVPVGFLSASLGVSAAEAIVKSWHEEPWLAEKDED